MTVQELIDALNEIRDKNQNVFLDSEEQYWDVVCIEQVVCGVVINPS